VPHQTPFAAPTAAASVGPDLTALLIDLSVAVQRRAMYPGGHPSLASTEQRLLERLTTLLAERQLLAIGVARDQLVIDGIATEGRHQLLRALAERLHAHQIAGIKFLGGVTKSEIEELLVRVGRDPRGAEDRREPLSGVSSPPGHHVQLYRQAYERLALAEDDGSMPIAAPAVARGTQLWLELALAAMSAQDANVSADIDPTIMARAIEARAIEAHADGDAPAAAGGADAAVYNQVVAGHLMQIAGELRSTQGADTATLRDRVSTLVTALSPRAIEGLITMGGNLTQRRAFLSDATAGMGVDAVLALTAATASVAKRPISQPLVRVLTKLAGHAQRGTAHIRPAADLAFRDHVRELVDGWTAPDLTAAGYGDVLDTLTRPPSPDDAGPITSGVTQFCEPERLLEMCIDLRNASTPLWDAVGALIARGNIVALLDTLDKTPADNPLLGVIRTRIATQENLRRLLDSPAVDGQRIEDFARRVGAAATDVLLDALASAKTRTARRRLLDVLSRLGDSIGPALVRRLATAPWYVQRNLLVIVGALPTWPEGFSPLPYVSHTDARVRREALRVMFKRAETRVAGITAAIGDSDPQLARLGLDTALKECPPAVVPRLLQRIGEDSFPQELVALAVQVLAASRAASAMPCLCGLATRRGRFLKRESVAPRSPVVLAALTGLAANWPEHPRVAKLVASARRSSDAAIRTAAAPRQPSSTPKQNQRVSTPLEAAEAAS